MKLRSALLFSAAGLALATLATCVLEGCAKPLSADQKRAAAGAEYFGKQLECVDANPTRETIDDCRRKVRAEWDAGRTDGGGAR
jgi:hypothetical protein